MLSFAKIYLLKIEVYKFFQTLNKILLENDFTLLEKMIDNDTKTTRQCYFISRFAKIFISKKIAKIFH